MPRTKAQKKGDALEDAVHLIETMILRTRPDTKEATVTIETKKRVTIDGVRHEIDIFITIVHGKGYKSIFIFECKNWEEAVGKNEIVLFSDKIKEVQAMKGYFIAKRYRRDAINQAKKDKRIELLKASTELDTLPPLITTYHFVGITPTRKELSLRVVTSDPQESEEHSNANEIRVRFRNEELSYQEFAQRIFVIVKDEVMNHEPTGTFSEGIYPYSKTETLRFQPGELFVDGLECRELDANVAWEAQIIRPKIVFKFDIQTRGRVVIVEFDKLPPGLDLTTAFIAID